MAIVRVARDPGRIVNLTQEQFAERFRIPIGTLRDWEQGRRKPEAPALAYLAVIEHETEAVDRALALERHAAQ